ncbi:hypothetical protein TNCV_3461771 [Trichonephila clavipes]|nr:hypothetical protein TNCV_3461771 [Trichonephila clavipes]
MNPSRQKHTLFFLGEKQLPPSSRDLRNLLANISGIFFCLVDILIGLGFYWKPTPKGWGRDGSPVGWIVVTHVGALVAWGPRIINTTVATPLIALFSCTKAFGDGPRNFERGQVTRTTPELEPPLLTTTPTKGRLSSRQIQRASLPYPAGLQW